jgi:hypothetical protein
MKSEKFELLPIHTCVLIATEFCMVVPNMCVVSMELASGNPSGTQNSEVASKFL